LVASERVLLLARLRVSSITEGSYCHLTFPAIREETLSWDPKISRDIRLSIPRTLSKIESPDAMDALLNGLNQEDGSLRYKIILGLEELSRRFPNLRVDSHVIETSIILEARRYYRRFLIFFALFGDDNDRFAHIGK
jgi:hypothetical protein